MKQHLLIWSLFLGALAGLSLMPEDPLPALIQKMQKWKDQYPQEKVFLVIDRGTYTIGETVWVKAFCTLEGQPSFLSKILYVDLVNNQTGQIVEKKMLKLDAKGASETALDINKDWLTGNYTLRAYTLWMKNFPQFIFQKSIFLYGKDFRKTSPTPSNNLVQLQFFPEGGELVAGVTNYLAFQATDRNGLPVAIQGSIQSGKQTIPFQSLHNGMGVIEFEPEAGASYTTQANVPIQKVSFPPIKNEGIALHVNNNSPNRATVLVQRADQAKEKYGKLFVIAQMNGKPVLTAKLNLDEDQNSFLIPKKDLPAGIVQVTIFAEDGKPLAERIFFVHNYSVLTPELSLDTLQKGARQKNHWTYQWSSTSPASLVAFVQDPGLASPVGVDDHLLSSLLLTSEIRGYVHQPGYYFAGKDTARANRLDLVMLTNGWRRFNWNALRNQDTVLLKYPVESSIQISGNMKKSEKGATVTNGKVGFIIKTEDSTTILSDAQLTDKGEFMVSGLDFNKSAKINFLGTENKRVDLPVNVTLYPSYIDSLRQVYPYQPLVNLDTFNLKTGNSSMANYLRGSIEKVDSFGKEYLANVTVTAKKKSPQDSLNAAYATGQFENVGSIIDPGKFPAYQSVWQIVQASVPGINVQGDMNNPNVYFNRFSGNDVFTSMSTGNTEAQAAMPGTDGGILYILNELPVSKEIINTLMPVDIALIKAVRGPEGFVLGASEGALIFYTKKGTERRTAIYDKDFATLNRMGYDIPRVFYQPDYTRFPQLQKAVPDTRATLYWDSNPKAEKDSRYHIRFHNNDQAKSYKLVIQGLDANGQIILLEKEVQ